MKFRNKGRKIYKTKEKNYYGKSPVSKAFSVGLTVILIGGIGFIGYSVAEPLVNYSKKKGDSSITVSESEDPSAIEFTSSSEGMTSPTESAVQPTISAEEYRAFALSANDIADTQSLELALHRVPAGQNIEYIEVPLKLSGGKLTYASSVLMADQLQGLQHMIKLSDIVTAVTKAGYKPVAVVSTFNDNLLPASYAGTGYVTADTGEQWNDNDPAAGGKPWTTPYSETTRSYIADILSEAAGAGFEKVVCTDMIYPYFRASDLEMLDPVLSGSDRYQAMTMAANMFNERILTNGSTMMLEVAATDILKNNDDVISQPMVLNVQSIILNINIDDIRNGVYASDTNYEFTGTASDMVKKMLDNDKIKERLSSFSNVAIRISGTSVGVDELLKAKEGISEYDYTSFIVG